MTIGSESEKASYTEAGLFGSVGKGAAIRNVGVINAAIYNKTTTDPSVGLLAAGISENSIVESCWATGTIYSDTTSPYYSYVGGLVGSIGIKSLICNSWTNVVVYAKGSSDSFVGGIVGDTGNNSAVVNCAALGSVANYGNTSMMYGAGGVVGYSSGAVYASYSSSRIHMDAMSSEDGADVPIGGVVGSPSALSAAYNCYFNKEEKQTYYDGEVSTPLAVGYDVLNYSESDNDHCEGLTAAEIASETLLHKLTAALTPEELAKGQAYFKSESLLTGDITLDSLLSMTENGWCTWERNADGALLTTAGGAVTPEEPDYFAGGDGSVGDPYQIATEAQLRAFAEATQAGKLVTTNVCFVLTADIALNGEWTPVHSFGGTFDGGDHTVSGMTIGTAEAPSTLVSAGFFDVLANTARVHDLHLTNASVYVQRAGAALDDRIYAGGLVGGAGLWPRQARRRTRPCAPALCQDSPLSCCPPRQMVSSFSRLYSTALLNTMPSVSAKSPLSIITSAHTAVMMVNIKKHFTKNTSPAASAAMPMRMNAAALRSTNGSLSTVLSTAASSISIHSAMPPHTSSIA